VAINIGVIFSSETLVPNYKTRRCSMTQDYRWPAVAYRTSKILIAKLLRVFCDVTPCRLARSNQPIGRNILQDMNLQRNYFIVNASQFHMKIHFNIILPSTFRFSKWPLFFRYSYLTTKTLYEPLLSPIRGTCPAHLILLDSINQIFGEQYRS